MHLRFGKTIAASVDRHPSANPCLGAERNVSEREIHQIGISFSGEIPARPEWPATAIVFPSLSSLFSVFCAELKICSFAETAEYQALSGHKTFAVYSV